MSEDGDDLQGPFYVRVEEKNNLVNEIKQLYERNKDANSRVKIDDRYLQTLDTILKKYAQPDRIGSRNKLSHVMKHIGLCLTNGKCY